MILFALKELSYDAPISHKSVHEIRSLCFGEDFYEDEGNEDENQGYQLRRKGQAGFCFLAHEFRGKSILRRRIVSVKTVLMDTEGI